MKNKRIIGFIIAFVMAFSSFASVAVATEEVYECSFSDPAYLEHFELTNGDGTITVENGALRLCGGTLYPPFTQAVIPFVCGEDFVWSFSVTASSLAENGFFCAVFGGGDDGKCYKVMYFDTCIRLVESDADTDRRVIFTSEYQISSAPFETTVAVTDGVLYVAINGKTVLQCMLKGRSDGEISLQAKGADVYIDDIVVSNSEYDKDDLSQAFDTDVYVPQTGIKNPPVIAAYDNAQSDGLPQDSARCAILIYTLKVKDGELFVLDGEAPAAELDVRYPLNEGKAVPAFSVSDAETAELLCEWIDENGVMDGFVISESGELIKLCTDVSPYLKGVIDASDAITVNSDDLYERARKSGCNAVIVSSAVGKGTVRSLQGRSITVFSSSNSVDDSELFSCLQNGYNGIICADGARAVQYLERYTENTVFRTPVVVSYGGDTAQGAKNSIPAFLAALKNGASGIMADVFVTADGIAVLSDDGILDALGGDAISDMRFSEIEKACARSEHNVQTLDRLLASVRDEYPDAFVRIQLLRESKYNSKAVSQAATKARMESRTMLLTSSEELLQYVNSQLDIKANITCTPYSAPNDEVYERVFYIHSYLQSTSSSYLGSKAAIPASLIPHLSARGVTVHPMGIDTAEELSSYFGASYDGFTTQCAGELVKYVSHIEATVDENGVLSAVSVGLNGEESSLGELELVTISGTLTLENGVLKGSGELALKHSVRLPTGAEYFIYSDVVRFEELSVSDGETVSGAERPDISKYSGHIIAAGMTLAVLAGFAVFLIIRKNKRGAKKQADENNSQQ